MIIDSINQEYFDKFDLARKSLGTRLKQYRNTHNLTQKDVARHVPCPQSQISKIEQGAGSTHLSPYLLRAYEKAKAEKQSCSTIKPDQS